MDVEPVVHRLIIPPGETEKLVFEAGAVYLRDCPCRVEMQVCPPDQWGVCMLFEHASEEDRQSARSISPEEAVEIIQTTTARGNIHQLFYFDEGDRPYELCNCCTCCCFPLREEAAKGDDFKDQLRSGYVAVTDVELCVGCGDCLESCFFGARVLVDDVIQLVDPLCFGCGVCLPTCPEEAIHLIHLPERGIPVPRV
jgi:ferredoxin